VDGFVSRGGRCGICHGEDSSCVLGTDTMSPSTLRGGLRWAGGRCRGLGGDRSWPCR
jgi:hypothetical protein